VSALPIRRFMLSEPISSTSMSTCFCRSSFTRLCHSPVRISFRSRVHGLASLTCLVPSSSVVPQSLNLRRSPVLLSFTGPRTCLSHQSAFPFVHGSTHLCRSPFPASSVLRRFSDTLSYCRILSRYGIWRLVVIEDLFICCLCRCTLLFTECDNNSTSTPLIRIHL
jgi:hypothetical protein